MLILEIDRDLSFQKQLYDVRMSAISRPVEGGAPAMQLTGGNPARQQKPVSRTEERDAPHERRGPAAITHARGGSR